MDDREGNPQAVTLRIVHHYFAILVLCVAVTVGPAVAVAQDGGEADAAKEGPLAGVVHEVSVSLEDCRRLVDHVPSADVAYQPGVDVDGNAVVPAEGPEGEQPLGRIQVPDEIVIDFGYDFAGAYGIPDTGLETATANILTVQYDLAAGALTVNGKPLKKADSRAVVKACEMMLGGHGAPDQ